MRILLIVVALFMAYSCRGETIPVADAADIALNTVTDTAQPMYEMTQRWCSAQEWTIVESGRTAAQKEAAVQKIRSRCDGVFELFETIIDLQKDARYIVDASRNGAGDALEALSRVREVQALLSEALRRFEKLRDMQ